MSGPGEGSLLMLGAIFTLATLFGLAFGLGLLFMPTLVARSRQHPNTGGIFVVNLLFGWTFIGWVVALAWACTRPAHPVLYRRQYPSIPASPERARFSAPVGTVLPPSASYGGRR
jgi:Superinfection immunity protein